MLIVQVWRAASVASSTRIPDCAIALATVCSLLVERERLDGAGKIFDGVELIVAGDDGDADRIDVWIQ